MAIPSNLIVVGKPNHADINPPHTGPEIKIYLLELVIDSQLVSSPKGGRLGTLGPITPRKATREEDRMGMILYKIVSYIHYVGNFIDWLCWYFL